MVREEKILQDIVIHREKKEKLHFPEKMAYRFYHILRRVMTVTS